MKPWAYEIILEALNRVSIGRIDACTVRGDPGIYLLESLLKIIKELALVALKLGGTTSELKLLRSGYTLAL